MNYTQIEIASGNRLEVVWIPVPEGKAKVGETITTTSYIPPFNPHDNPTRIENWKITQVCITLPLESIPYKSKVASNFQRHSISSISMSI